MVDLQTPHSVALRCSQLTRKVLYSKNWVLLGETPTEAGGGGYRKSV